jgi:hypothetical protein
MIERPPVAVCQICLVDDGYIHTRDATWFMCQVHKVRWRENYRRDVTVPDRAPFQADWTDEKIWAHRENMLREYVEVAGRPKDAAVRLALAEAYRRTCTETPNVARVT